MADEIALKLSRDQALVLFDWLARTSNAGEPARFDDQAEQRVLSDLESALETVLTEMLNAHYRAKVAAARGRVRDLEE